MTYPETIKYLESFINYEKIPAYPYRKSLKLERINKFLRGIGNPQDTLRCIHVAGSKGKGSTCAFITNILREAGFRVGLYTSPHLLDFRERIRILNPKQVHNFPAKLSYSRRDPASNIEMQREKKDFEGMISRYELAKLVSQLKPAVEKFNKNSKYGRLSFFEVYTTLAFIYFKKKKVDFTVLETGLGGRLDATNTVNALVSVITPISYEHTRILGNTLAKIAREKAGIIKAQGSGLRAQGLNVISAPQKKEAQEVIRNRCKEVGAKLIEINAPIEGTNLGLLGEHQRINAAVARQAVEALKLGIKEKTIQDALAKTVWPGRCEVISKNPLIVLDGAQNIASAQALKKAIREKFKFKNLILVLGISSDKDIKGICDELCDLADKVIITQANNPRAAEPPALAKYFQDKETHLTENIGEARKLAQLLAKKKDLILVTGSLFVVGEFR